MNVLVVLNPISGGKSKDIFIRDMKEKFKDEGIRYSIYETTGQDDKYKIYELTQKYDPDRILSIGGDGTNSICVKSLVDHDAFLGIIPFGSANGMAVELGISEDPDEALDDFLHSDRYKELDLYQVNDKYYGMHIGDIGLNARIVEGFSKEEGRGMFSYAKHFLKELSQSELIDFTIHTGDETFNTQAFMVAFANAKRYGTGVVLNWKGNLFDGKIELVLAKDLKIKTLLLAGMTTLSDEFAKEAPSEIISIEEAVITTKEPVSVQIDGEPIGKLQEVKVKVLPRAVRVVIPENIPG